MKRGVEDALSFVAGLTLGGTLTYLLDPDLGRRRRRTIARTTRGALHDATESTTAAVGRATGAAADAAYRAGHAAGLAVGAAKGYGAAATRTVGSTAASAYDAGEDWLDSAYGAVSRRLSSAGDAVGSTVGRATSTAATTTTAATGGLLGSLSALFAAADDSANDAARTTRRSAGRATDQLSAAVQRKKAEARQRAIVAEKRLLAARRAAAARVAGSRSNAGRSSDGDGPWYAPWLGAAVGAGSARATGGRQRLFDRAEGPPEARRPSRGRPAAARGDSHDGDDDGFAQAMLGFGLVGVGAGLAYLLDTERGRTRRALIAARVPAVARDAARDAARAVGSKAVHAANVTRGAVAETVAAARTATGDSESADDATLEARARSEAGHVVDDVDALNLSVTDARIALAGRAASAHVDALVERLEAIPGVRAVDNRLGAD